MQEREKISLEEPGHTIGEVYTEISQLRDLFARRLMDDKVKSAAIDKLLQSNSELTKVIEDKRIIDFVKELILVCDRIYTQPLSDEFAYSILDEILEIFARRGIEQIHQLDIFDPHIHNSVSTVPASSDCLPNTIVQVMRHGYVSGKCIIRAADVVVSVNE